MPYYGHKKTAAKPQVLNAFEPPKKDAGVQRRQSFLEYILKYKPQVIGFILQLCLKQKMPTILFIYGWR